MSNSLLRSAIAVGTATLCSTAFAQNDECTTAMTVGPGAIPFDTSAATLSPEAWPCAGNGGPDLWYTFTATTTGDVTVSTCGSSYDTALEVFSGTCAALAPISCNDDSCGLQSSLTFFVTTGTDYIFRVGGFAGSTGSGTIVLDLGLPMLNPANGNFYQRIPVVGITWDQARADAAAATFMGIAGRLVTLNDQQEHDFVFGLGDVNNHWVGGFQNTASPTYSEPGGGWEWITGEPFAYTNWLVGEPNNTGAFGAEDYLELLQSTGFGETWNDAAQMEHPRGYVIEFSSGALGTNYCAANPNSTGAAGSMSASGSPVAANDDLTLTCAEMPNNAFGFFLTSLNQGFVSNPGGSQGNLCLGGAIGRYVGPGQIQQSGSAGEVSLLLVLGQTPTPTGPVVVIAGDTWNYQCWFRDSVGGQAVSNFSDGLEVLFL